MTPELKTVYERDGVFYRRVGDAEYLRLTDKVAWKKDVEKDRNWTELYNILGTKRTEPYEHIREFVYLRRCHPLTAAMLTALENAGKETGM